MLESQSLQFVIHHPGGRVQKLCVDSESARIGSGAHCEIRLPPEDAAVEQLAVEARAGGVFAEARSLDPPTLMNGVPFAQGRLLPEAVLHVGRIELSVSVSVTSTLEGTSRRRTKQRSNPVVYLLGLIGFPLGFYLLLTGRSAAAPLPDAVPPPKLFAAVQSECPEREPEAARARAESERLAGEAARERAPFRAEEGVNAVELFARAAACFELSGDGRSATESRKARERLERKVSDDFHVHQVRLEHALATKAYDRARVETRALLGFVARRGGDYSAWLSNLERQLELKFTGKKR